MKTGSYKLLACAAAPLFVMRLIIVLFFTEMDTGYVSGMELVGPALLAVAVALSLTAGLFCRRFSAGEAPGPSPSGVAPAILFAVASVLAVGGAISALMELAERCGSLGWLLAATREQLRAAGLANSFLRLRAAAAALGFPAAYWLVTEAMRCQRGQKRPPAGRYMAAAGMVWCFLRVISLYVSGSVNLHSSTDMAVMLSAMCTLMWCAKYAAYVSTGLPSRAIPSLCGWSLLSLLVSVGFGLPTVFLLVRVGRTAEALLLCCDAALGGAAFSTAFSMLASSEDEPEQETEVS